MPIKRTRDKMCAERKSDEVLDNAIEPPRFTDIRSQRAIYPDPGGFSFQNTVDVFLIVFPDVNACRFLDEREGEDEWKGGEVLCAIQQPY